MNIKSVVRATTAVVAFSLAAATLMPAIAFAEVKPASWDEAVVANLDGFSAGKHLGVNDPSAPAGGLDENGDQEKPATTVPGLNPDDPKPSDPKPSDPKPSDPKPSDPSGDNPASDDADQNDDGLQSDQTEPTEEGASLLDLEEEAEKAPEVVRPPVPPTAGVHRVAGVNRYETSALTSKLMYPGGANTVIVASGQAFPDALSAAPLAAKLGAPLLITTMASLSQPTRSEITRLAPEHILVIGGVGAVSAAVERDLATLAPEVTRLGGANRYETSNLIAGFGWPEGVAQLFVATGTNYADALAAGPAAAKLDSPVILVPSAPSGATTAARNLITQMGVTKVHVAGGTGAVSNAVVAAAAGSATIQRYAGVNRYETANLIVRNNFSPPVEAVFWTSGENFPDALGGAAAAGAIGSPLLLSRTSCIPLSLRDEANRLAPTSRVILGGEAVLSRNVSSGNACFSAAQPKISGTAKVGSTLTGSAGAWDPTPTQFAYQWLRSGQVISGATAASYKIVKADTGHAISLRVTGSRAGFATTTVVSRATGTVSDPASINDSRLINVVVNKKRPLNPIRYVPANLRYPAGISNPNGQPLRAEAATALENMNAAARRAGFSLILQSGYRSYDLQNSLYYSYVRANGYGWADSYSARPGHSEHQTGLAADIYEARSCTGSCFGGSAAGLWLRNNAHTYGFILRYDQGMRPIVGYEYEPWHFRYVGVDTATKYKRGGFRALETYYGLPAAPSY